MIAETINERRSSTLADGCTEHYRYADGCIVHRLGYGKGKRIWQDPAGPKGSTTPLYRDNKIRAAVREEVTVYVVEGERDVEALERAGVTATTSRGGSSNAKRADWSALAGAAVVLIPDQDDAGMRYAKDVRRILRGLGCNITVKRPLVGFNDISDHLDAGHSVIELLDAPPLSEPTSWVAVDLDAILTGEYQPAQPTIGQRADGVGILYAGKRHLVVGESESGKSWFALLIAAQELHKGHGVLFIDFEDDGAGIVGRLLALDVSREVIAAHFRYLRPDTPISDDGVEFADLTAAYQEIEPTICVIDGVTEGMACHGLSVNSNDDVAIWDHLLARPVAELGAAVLSVDHVVKSNDNRGRYALGGVHKINAIDGAVFVLENVTAFGVGRAGRSRIKISKDRPGQLRRQSQPGSMFGFGDLVITSHGASVEASIETSAKADQWRPTHLMAELSNALANESPLSQAQILARVGGNTEAKKRALEYLVSDGFVRRERGERNAILHYFVRAYDEPSEGAY
jgi:5S rRNA maturation endonuclease (ribonuclease M5)